MREPAIKVVAMPKDANADGDIFGGWILSMMDLAGGIVARRRADRRVVTVAIDEVVFHKPVFIGDTVECFAEITKVGSTSVTVKVETYVDRRNSGDRHKVTEGTLIFVAIGEDRRPCPIPPENACGV
ncbi:MAG: acyl-CoA thioesterase [Rickettsiales bacterium]